MMVNTRDDKKRWWEVVDRSTGNVVSADHWEYEEEKGCVVIHDAIPFHEYTVSFLAYIIWIQYICTMRLPTTGKTLNIRLLST